MKSGENIISDLFEALGYKPKRFSKAEMKNRRTPDFKVHMDDKLVFYCEEKSFVNNSGFYDNVTSDVVTGIEKGSTKSNRLVHQCREAIKQFISVNPEHAIPNIIAIINHDKTFFPDEVIELFQGYAFIEDGIKTHYIPKNSRDRISKELHLIDAVIVLQRIKETGENFNRLYYQNSSFELLEDFITRYKKWNGQPELGPYRDNARR